MTNLLDSNHEDSRAEAQSRGGLSLRLCASARAIFFLLAIVGLSTEANAQSGVLIPTSVTDRPAPEVIELTEMTVSVTVDRQLARTRVMHIFANRIDRPIEGTYVFAIPTTASIADFAVWDGDVRIPGVILEKRTARDIYEKLAAQAIDPGLLEQEDAEEATTAFTVRVAPIPAFGTKRLEIEYTELLPVDDLQSYYSLPLKPSDYGQQLVKHLRIDVALLSGFPLTGVTSRGNQFPLAVTREEPNAYAAHFEGTDVQPAQDFAFTFGVAVPKSQLDVIAYRAPERISPAELRDPALAARQPDGYFQATAVFNGDGRAPGAARVDDRPRSVVLALDTSLSMSGEKLDRAYEAMQYFLGALTPRDRFNLLLFNDDVLALGDEPVAGTPDQIERALGFVRAGYLSGGTDLETALTRALDAAQRLPASDGERAIVVVTDGNPTLTTTQTKRLLERFKRANDSGPRARLAVFGIGSDTRVPLSASSRTRAGGSSCGPARPRSSSSSSRDSSARSAARQSTTSRSTSRAATSTTSTPAFRRPATTARPCIGSAATALRGRRRSRSQGGRSAGASTSEARSSFLSATTRTARSRASGPAPASTRC